MKQSSILPLFFRYVSLNVLGMIGLSCYILADTYFIAWALGAQGLAALNLAISVYSIIHASGLMIGIGGATQYAIAKAKGRDREASQIFSNTLVFCFIVSMLFLFCGVFFADSLASALGADEITFPLTTVYLKVILCFAPFFMMNNTLLAFVRNDKNPKLSMAAMLCGSFGNIVLDYIFIIPLSMGMFGAALATGIAPILSMAVLSLHRKQKNQGLRLIKFRFSLGQIGKTCSLGLSSFITEVASGVVLIVFNLTILSINGNIGVAAYGIVANLALVGASIFTGVAQGIQPLASKGYGSNDKTLLRQLINYTLVLSIGLAGMLYGVVVYFADPLIALFNKDQVIALVEIAQRGFLLYFLGFFFAGINITMAAFFSAVAKPQVAFFISIARGVGVILPLTAILPPLFGMDGVWLSFTGAEGVTLLITLAGLFRYLRTLKEEGNVIGGT